MFIGQYWVGKRNNFETISSSRYPTIGNFLYDMKNTAVSWITNIGSGIKQAMYSGFTSRQGGISNIITSGSWYVPTSIIASGLLFRNEFSNIVGKFLVVMLTKWGDAKFKKFQE